MKINLLAIVAHPDDAELCCAGTLLKHKQLDYSIGIIDLTKGEMGSRGTAETRAAEANKSATILGLSARENLDLGDATFANNFENKLAIIEQIRRFQPDIVLTNTVKDRHPDHERAGKLVADSCFYSGLLKIETSWEDQSQQVWRPKQLWHMVQDYYVEPDISIDVTAFWEQKREAILAFSTQFYQEEDNGPKTPISGKDFWDFLEARARQFGRPIGAEFGEGFVKSRDFGVTNLFELV